MRHLIFKTLYTALITAIYIIVAIPIAFVLSALHMYGLGWAIAVLFIGLYFLAHFQANTAIDTYVALDKLFWCVGSKKG